MLPTTAKQVRLAFRTGNVTDPLRMSLILPRLVVRGTEGGKGGGGHLRGVAETNRTLMINTLNVAAKLVIASALSILRYVKRRGVTTVFYDSNSPDENYPLLRIDDMDLSTEFTNPFLRFIDFIFYSLVTTLKTIRRRVRLSDVLSGLQLTLQYVMETDPDLAGTMDVSGKNQDIVYISAFGKWPWSDNEILAWDQKKMPWATTFMDGVRQFKRDATERGRSLPATSDENKFRWQRRGYFMKSKGQFVQRGGGGSDWVVWPDTEYWKSTLEWYYFLDDRPSKLYLIPRPQLPFSLPKFSSSFGFDMGLKWKPFSLLGFSGAGARAAAARAAFAAADDECRPKSAWPWTFDDKKLEICTGKDWLDFIETLKKWCTESTESTESTTFPACPLMFKSDPTCKKYYTGDRVFILSNKEEGTIVYNGSNDKNVIDSDANIKVRLSNDENNENSTMYSPSDLRRLELWNRDRFSLTSFFSLTHESYWKNVFRSHVFENETKPSKLRKVKVKGKKGYVKTDDIKFLVDGSVVFEGWPWKWPEGYSAHQLWDSDRCSWPQFYAAVQEFKKRGSKLPNPPAPLMWVPRFINNDDDDIVYDFFKMIMIGPVRTNYWSYVLNKYRFESEKVPSLLVCEESETFNKNGMTYLGWPWTWPRKSKGFFSYDEISAKTKWTVEQWNQYALQYMKFDEKKSSLNTTFTRTGNSEVVNFSYLRHAFMSKKFETISSTNEMEYWQEVFTFFEFPPNNMGPLRMKHGLDLLQFGNVLNGVIPVPIKVYPKRQLGDYGYYILDDGSKQLEETFKTKCKEIVQEMESAAAVSFTGKIPYAYLLPTSFEEYPKLEFGDRDDVVEEGEDNNKMYFMNEGPTSQQQEEVRPSAENRRKMWEKCVQDTGLFMTLAEVSAVVQRNRDTVLDEVVRRNQLELMQSFGGGGGGGDGGGGSGGGEVDGTAAYTAYHQNLNALTWLDARNNIPSDKVSHWDKVGAKWSREGSGGEQRDKVFLFMAYMRQSLAEILATLGTEEKDVIYLFYMAQSEPDSQTPGEFPLMYERRRKLSRFSYYMLPATDYMFLGFLKNLLVCRGEVVGTPSLMRRLVAAAATTSKETDADVRQRSGLAMATEENERQQKLKSEIESLNMQIRAGTKQSTFFEDKKKINMLKDKVEVKKKEFEIVQKVEELAKMYFEFEKSNVKDDSRK